jgi:hypothetical protein
MNLQRREFGAETGDFGSGESKIVYCFIKCAT